MRWHKTGGPDKTDTRKGARVESPFNLQNAKGISESVNIIVGPCRYAAKVEDPN